MKGNRFSRILQILWIAGIPFLCTVCSTNAVFDETVALPDEGWNFKKPVEFTFPITDTTDQYDILLHLRNNKNYDYSNLWLYLQTTAPGGAIQRDTLELLLADGTGKWLGKGTRSINTMLVPYLQSVRFPQLGVYTINIQHAMRDTILYNLSDIGVRVQLTQSEKSR
jgi:gliding motility-associated lipoprotein GldH